MDVLRRCELLLVLCCKIPFAGVEHLLESEECVPW